MGILTCPPWATCDDMMIPVQRVYNIYGVRDQMAGMGYCTRDFVIHLYKQTTLQHNVYILLNILDIIYTYISTQQSFVGSSQLNSRSSAVPESVIVPRSNLGTSTLLTTLAS